MKPTGLHAWLERTERRRSYGPPTGEQAFIGNYLAPGDDPDELRGAGEKIWSQGVMTGGWGHAEKHAVILNGAFGGFATKAE